MQPLQTKQTKVKTSMIDQSEKTLKETLPEVFGLSEWDPQDYAIYLVLTTKRKTDPYFLMQMAKDAMIELEDRNGTKDELLYFIRVEWMERQYLSGNVLDPYEKRPHAHIIIGKHKLINSIRNPNRDIYWVVDQFIGNDEVIGLKPIWNNGLVYLREHEKYINGPLPYGALVYNLKNSRGNNNDFLPFISKRLTRHIRRSALEPKSTETTAQQLFISYAT
jgi:hypothetical protein